MLGEAAKTHRRRRALRRGLRRRARPHRRARRRAASASRPGISVKLSALHPRYEWSHAEEAKAAILPVLRELALKASAADVHFTIDAEEADRLELSMDMIEALARRRRAVRQRLGRLRARDPGLSEARRAAVRLGRRAGPRARPQADGPAGQGRLLGHARSRPRRSPGLPDYPVFTRKVATDVSYLACAKRLLAAERRHLLRPSPPTTPTPSARSRRWPARRRSSSSACTAWARGCTRSWPSSKRRSATRRRRCASTRRSAATRNCSPISSAACSKTAPIPASSTASPTSDVPVDELVRDPVAELEALEPKRNPAIPLPRRDLRRGAPQQRRRRPERSAGARAVARAADRRSRAAAGPPRRRSARARRRADRLAVRHVASSSARSFEASAADVDRMVRAGARRAASTGTRSAARRAPRCSTAPPTCSKSIARNSSRCASARPGKTLPDAVLEVREAVDFLRFYASRGAAPVHQADCRFPARPASRTSCACTAAACSPAFQPVEFPAGDLHRPGRGARWPRAMPSSPSRPGRRR